MDISIFRKWLHKQTAVCHMAGQYIYKQDAFIVRH